MPNNNDYNSRERGFNLREWGINLASNFISDIVYRINTTIKREQEKFLKRIIALAAILIGGLFFLVGISLMISALIGQGLWTGYLIVGVLILGVGFLLKS